MALGFLSSHSVGSGWLGSGDRGAGGCAGKLDVKPRSEERHNAKTETVMVSMYIARPCLNPRAPRPRSRLHVKPHRTHSRSFAPDSSKPHYLEISSDMFG